MKRLIVRTAAMLAAALLCFCLLPGRSLADATPEPAAATAAQPGLSTTGTIVACVCGAVTGFTFVFLRRRSGRRHGKSYMPSNKKKTK